MHFKLYEGYAKETNRLTEKTGISLTTGDVDQSIKRLVDPHDIAALAVFIASDSGKSISGQMLPIDNDMQKAS